MSSDEILAAAVRDGSIDIAEWPRVLESVLQKLHNIVHNDFPLPSIPLPAPLLPPIDPDVVASTPPPPASDPEPQYPLHTSSNTNENENENEPPPNSQSSTKENDAPPSTAPTSQPASGFDLSHRNSQTQPPDSVEMQSGTLPPDLLSMYNNSTHVLERDFAQSPPYTIQRLAELVTEPKKHYRYLPAYLRALDRIVSVSSPLSDFPLPTLQASSHGGFLTNGDVVQVNGANERESLGSDESLGGALLTPIPWLRNATQSSGGASQDGELHSESTETIEGPNGAGSIETVSVTMNGVPSASSAAHTSPTPASPTLSEQSDASTGSNSSTEVQLRELGAVTQGELLRQEQEAGVVPVGQAQPRRHLISSGAVAVGRESALNFNPAAFATSDPDVVTESEELPHARGPEEIGMEDMGPQRANTGPGAAGHLDMEAAVGRQKSPPAAASAPLSHTPAVQPIPAPAAEAADQASKASDAGAPGKDLADVEKEVEQLKESMDEEQKAEAKDADGDVIVADADGKEVEEKEKMDVTGDLGGPDAAR